MWLHVCSFIWLFADLCWLWCVPWLSVATRIWKLFCQSWQLPLCRSTGCPARLWKVWLSSHYSSTHPCTAHGFPATTHPKLVAFQPPFSNDVAVQPPQKSQWLSSHHSAMLWQPLLSSHHQKANGFPATIQLKQHCVTILAAQPPPKSQWLSSHHSAKTPLCDNSGCPAITTRQWLSSHKLQNTVQMLTCFFHSLPSTSSSIPGSQIPFKTRWKANWNLLSTLDGSNHAGVLLTLPLAMATIKDMKLSPPYAQHPLGARYLHCEG